MIIRFYGGPMQALLSRYLEQAFTTMLQQQEAVQAQMAKALQTPFAPLAELVRKNAEMWGFAGRGADDSKSAGRGDTKTRDDAKTQNNRKKGK
jgi:polyhydroxyalkanoate synthesis regulator protein